MILMCDCMPNIRKTTAKRIELAVTIKGLPIFYVGYSQQ